MSFSRVPESRLRVPQRMQMTMSMAAIDDLVDAEHPVRLLWRVVDSLDLSRFHAAIKVDATTAGRDATDPRLLVTLWLYAATQGIGSARELARRCESEAAFRWLCGGITLNHHTLSDFRVGHAEALDDLFTQVIASLVHRGLLSVHRISQDGTRVRWRASPPRACCGASSLRRRDRLNLLLEEARTHVAELRRQLEDPVHSAGLSAKQKAARTRAARERETRIEQAISQLPELETRQKKLARRVSKKDKAAGKLREPRASTTDADARVMKMPNGGFNPALNVQLATDTQSRVIVGVEVINQGVDNGQLAPMRKQVQERTGLKVNEHLVDGGYMNFEEIEQSSKQNVTIYMPPKPPRDPAKYGDQYTPREADSDAVNAWRERMGSEEAKEIYKQRAATSETVNADLKTHRGLTQLTVRSLPKARCVALWCALAYNLMHMGSHLA